MNCPSCRNVLGAGEPRCGSCGAIVGVPSEGALAPDLRPRSRTEPLREIPALRKPPRTWRDEVRERVQRRRQTRTGVGAPADPAPEPLELSAPASPEGTLVDLGPPEPRGPSPYAVTEELDSGPGPVSLGEPDADLPLGPPRLDVPRDPEPTDAAAPGPDDAPPGARRWAYEPLPAEDDPSAEVRGESFMVGGVAERVTAALIDLAVWGALAVLVVYFASRIARVPVEGLLPVWPWLGAYLAMLGLAYAAWFTGTTGQTVGKIATGLRVVDTIGRPPGSALALARATLGLLGVAVAFAGVVPLLLDPERRAVHDRVSGTRVVRA